MSNKVLVAGGLGYLGSQVAAALASKHEVTVIDRLRFPWLDHERLLRLLARVQYWNSDIADLEKADLTSFETVIFVAGISNDPVADFDPFDNIHENTALPLRLCSLAEAAGCRRFVAASSCSVYDGLDDRTLATPSKCLAPEGHYSKSKYAVDLLLPSMRTPEFKTLSFRMGTLHGLSDRMRFDLVVNRMVRDAILNNSITITGTGHEWRPMLSIDAAVAAYVQAANAKYDDGQTIRNVAEVNVTVQDIAIAVQRAAMTTGAGNPTIAFGPPPQRRRSYRAALDDDATYSPHAQTCDSIFVSASKMFDELRGWSYDHLESEYTDNISYIRMHERQNSRGE